MKFKKDHIVNLIILLAGVINPLTYFISPGILLLSLLIEVVGLYFLLDSFEKKLWVIYLFLFQYFSIAILNIKLYDLMTLLVLGTVYVNPRKTLKRATIYDHRIQVMLFCIILILPVLVVFSMKLSLAFVEYMRYLMCLVILVIFSSSKVDLLKIRIFFLPLVLSNLATGVILYFLTYKLFGYYPFEGPIFTVDYHYHEIEHRLSGFSSDPNKYYLYFFSIVLVVDLLEETYSRIVQIKANRIRLLCIGAAVLSLSRVAFLSALGYAAVRYFRVKLLRRNNKLYFQILVFTVIFLGVNFNSIVDLLDSSIRFLTELAGRERTLAYAPSLTESNRMRIWVESINLIKNNWLTGYGLFSWKAFLPYPPHNTILNLLLDFGIVGLTLYLYLYWPVLKRCYLESYIFLFLLPFMTLDLQSYRLFYILLSVVLFKSVYIRLPQKHENLPYRAGTIK